MKIFLEALLLTFTLYNNFAGLWAADDPDHQLPPPGPNRFAGYPESHTFFLNGHLVGRMTNGRFVEFPEYMARARAETTVPVMKPKELAEILPDGAEVFRPHVGRIGYLFDRRINGPDEKGEVRVLAAQVGDLIIVSGKTLAKYNDGWKEVKLVH